MAGDGDRHLDIGPPKGEALLADAAWREDEKWPVGFAARNAYRCDNTHAYAICLAVGPGLVAQTGTVVRRVEAHARKYLAGICAYRCRTGVAGRKPGKRLLYRGIDERLIEWHARPNV